MGNDNEIPPFPRKIVQRVDKNSYIINTLECLSQIYEFTFYFIKNDMPKDKQIVGDFKEYMKNLWTDDKKLLSPIEFMKNLIKISDRTFSLEIELEPYKFYEYILYKLNEELKDFDKDITKYHDNLIEKYKEDKEIQEYLEKYKKENNSIVSKTFNGIMKIKNFCMRCNADEKNKYEVFNIIRIDINEFYKIKEKFVFSLEECIDYYFEDDKESNSRERCNNEGCNRDLNKRKFKKSIIELPNYLIFRINWGNFTSEVGFNCKINGIKPSYNCLNVNEIIEIKKSYLNEISYNGNNKLDSEKGSSVKFKLFSTINYYNEKKIFITKYKIKEKDNDNWYNFWCNGEGIEKKSYVDDFTVPCLLFYEKI